MKTPLRLLLTLTVILVVTEAHAMRWYSASTGRWFSRDPIQDPGFLNSHAARELSSSSPELGPFRMTYRGRTSPALETYAWRWDSTHRINIILGGLAGGNLYLFVDNGPTGEFDPLGLLKFGKNCTEQQQKDIQKAMSDICEKAKKNNCFRCLSKNGQSWMKDFCDNKLKGTQEATIECDDDKTNKDCATTCGNSVAWSKVIHLCFNNINNAKVCPGMGCTIIHEATHAMAGKTGEEEAYGIEKCSGCTVPPKQKLPPGY